MRRVITILLAGGAGERLAPLTRDQPKPMMPFGGTYRLIDIPLSNCLNSGLSRIYVLTQYKALSLHRHIREAWNILSPELDQFIEVIPPTQRQRNTWYLGTADAVYQNIQSIEEEDAEVALILSADHVYKGWPLRTAPSRFPPAKFIFAEEGRRMGIAMDSLVAHGCIISGGRVTRSVLSSGVRIDSYSVVEDSIIFPGVDVGRYSRIRRAIIDQNLRLPEHTVIGIDPDADRRAGHFVSDSGLVVLHPGSPGITLVVPPRSHNTIETRPL